MFLSHTGMRQCLRRMHGARVIRRFIMIYRIHIVNSISWKKLTTHPDYDLRLKCIFYFYNSIMYIVHGMSQ